MKRLIVLLLFVFVGAYALDTIVVADATSGVASRTSSPSLATVTAVTVNFKEIQAPVAPAAIGAYLPTADYRVTVNVNGTNYLMLLRSI